MAGEPTAKPREQPSSGRHQQAPLAELNHVMEATRAKLEELFGGTEAIVELRTQTELLGQENERLNGQLAAAKGQVGEAFTAADEAERARQRAVSEAQQVRSQGERANAELVAARKEIQRLQAANDELEQQIASLDADRKRQCTAHARPRLSWKRRSVRRDSRKQRRRPPRS
jgi:chromosome segregation ATPase